jgi:hypothetical protein
MHHTSFCSKLERLALTVTSSVVNYLKAMMELNPRDFSLLQALPANNGLGRSEEKVTNALAFLKM